jgi:hypothetical protein
MLTNGLISMRNAFDMGATHSRISADAGLNRPWT